MKTKEYIQVNKMLRFKKEQATRYFPNKNKYNRFLYDYTKH